MITIQIILYIILLAVVGRVRIVIRAGGIAIGARTTPIVWTLVLTGCILFWSGIIYLIQLA